MSDFAYKLETDEQDFPVKQMESETKSTSLVSGNGFTVVPRTMDDAFSWADRISRSQLIPSAFRTPAGAPKDASKAGDVYIACARGAELGMSPIQSLMSINVVNGHATLSTDSKKALCMRYGRIKQEYDESDGNPKWIVTVKRKDCEDVSISYSARDAAQAGLMAVKTENITQPDGTQKAVSFWCGVNGAWIGYWKRMLLKRAMSWALDEAFPDILNGFGTTEEYEDIKDVKPNFTQPVNEQAIVSNQPQSQQPKTVSKKTRKKKEIEVSIEEVSDDVKEKPGAAVFGLSKEKEELKKDTNAEHQEVKAEIVEEEKKVESVKVKEVDPFAVADDLAEENHNPGLDPSKPKKLAVETLYKNLFAKLDVVEEQPFPFKPVVITEDFVKWGQRILKCSTGTQMIVMGDVLKDIKSDLDPETLDNLRKVFAQHKAEIDRKEGLMQSLNPEDRIMSQVMENE